MAAAVLTDEPVAPPQRAPHQRRADHARGDDATSASTCSVSKATAWQISAVGADWPFVPLEAAMKIALQLHPARPAPDAASAA